MSVSCLAQVIKRYVAAHMPQCLAVRGDVFFFGGGEDWRWCLRITSWCGGHRERAHFLADQPKQAQQALT